MIPGPGPCMQSWKKKRKNNQKKTENAIDLLQLWKENEIKHGFDGFDDERWDKPGRVAQSVRPQVYT